LKASRVKESMCRRGSEVSGTGRGVKSIIIIIRRLRERNRLLEIYKNRINKLQPPSMMLT
jgi:hypothetical protein